MIDQDQIKNRAREIASQKWHTPDDIEVLIGDAIFTARVLPENQVRVDDYHVVYMPKENVLLCAVSQLGTT